MNQERTPPMELPRIYLIRFWGMGPFVLRACFAVGEQ